MKKGYKLMTAQEFDNIKLLQKAGLTNTKAGQVTGRASSTISYIYTTNTFEEYKRHAIEVRKPKLQPEAVQITPAEQRLFDMKAEVNLVALLNRVDNTLDRLNKTLQRTNDNWDKYWALQNRNAVDKVRTAWGDGDDRVRPTDTPHI